MPRILTQTGGAINCQAGKEPHLILLRGDVIVFNRSAGDIFTEDTDITYPKGNLASAVFNHRISIIPKSLEGVFPRAMVRTSRRLSRMRFSNPVRVYWEGIGPAMTADLILDRRRKYESFVADLAVQGLLSWSSGTSARLARVDQETGVIRQWGIKEFSLILTPLEPQMTVSRAGSIEDRRLLGRIFGVDVEKMITEQTEALLEFQMLHEDHHLFHDE